jgi:hypothetical protein
MAYDRELADRVRDNVEHEKGLTEKRMFGGLAFMINGNLAVSASSKGGLLLRVDPSTTDELVQQPGVERFEMRGRQMNGWLHIDVDAHAAGDVLAGWISRGVAFARALPPK